MMAERKKVRVLVRVTASDGAEWTIYDVTWSDKRYHRRPHGDPTATTRMNVSSRQSSPPGEKGVG